MFKDRKGVPPPPYSSDCLSLALTAPHAPSCPPLSPIDVLTVLLLANGAFAPFFRRYLGNVTSMWPRLWRTVIYATVCKKRTLTSTTWCWASLVTTKTTRECCLGRDGSQNASCASSVTSPTWSCSPHGSAREDSRRRRGDRLRRNETKKTDRLQHRLAMNYMHGTFLLCVGCFYCV